MISTYYFNFRRNSFAFNSLPNCLKKYENMFEMLLHLYTGKYVLPLLSFLRQTQPKSFKYGERND